MTYWNFRSQNLILQRRRAVPAGGSDSVGEGFDFREEGFFDSLFYEGIVPIGSDSKANRTAIGIGDED